MTPPRALLLVLCAAGASLATTTATGCVFHDPPLAGAPCGPGGTCELGLECFEGVCRGTPAFRGEGEGEGEGGEGEGEGEGAGEGEGEGEGGEGEGEGEGEGDLRFGNGQDGFVDLTGSTTYSPDIDVGVASVSGSVVHLDSVAGFAVGDRVLLINRYTGAYDVHQVLAVSSNQITIDGSTAVDTGARAIFMPQQSGMHITGDLHTVPFNGITGGILALFIQGTLQIDGAGIIDLDQQGFPGGGLGGGSGTSFSHSGGNQGDGVEDTQSCTVLDRASAAGNGAGGSGSPGGAGGTSGACEGGAGGTGATNTPVQGGQSGELGFGASAFADATTLVPGESGSGGRGGDGGSSAGGGGGGGGCVAIGGPGLSGQPGGASDPLGGGGGNGGGGGQSGGVVLLFAHTINTSAGVRISAVGGAGSDGDGGSDGASGGPGGDGASGGVCVAEGGGGGGGDGGIGGDGGDGGDGGGGGAIRIVTTTSLTFIPDVNPGPGGNGGPKGSGGPGGAPGAGAGTATTGTAGVTGTQGNRGSNGATGQPGAATVSVLPP